EGRRSLAADRRIAELAEGGIAIRALSVIHACGAECVAGSKPVVDALILIRQRPETVGADVAANRLIGAVKTNNGHRESRVSQHQEAGIPSADDEIGDPAHALAEWAVGSDGQVPCAADCEVVMRVEEGASALRAAVIGILPVGALAA